MELFKDLKSGAAWAGNLGWWSPWLKFPNCTAGAVDPPGGGRGGGVLVAQTLFAWTNRKVFGVKRQKNWGETIQSAG